MRYNLTKGAVSRRELLRRAWLGAGTMMVGYTLIPRVARANTLDDGDVSAVPGSVEDAPALAGASFALVLTDPTEMTDGGLGTGGQLTLVCTVNASDRAPIPVSEWTQGAIIGTLPLTAPCNHGQLSWKVVVEPDSGDPTIVEPVFIEGPPGSSGYPPVGQH